LAIYNHAELDILRPVIRIDLTDSGKIYKKGGGGVIIVNKQVSLGN